MVPLHLCVRWRMLYWVPNLRGRHPRRRRGLTENSNGTADCRQSNRPIVFACHGSYAMPLATTLRSVTESNRRGWPLDVHVLADGFPDDTRMKVLESLPRGSASIRWVPADLEPFQGFSPGGVGRCIGAISKIIFARFLIPRLFPETVSRVLYLDADLLVFGDLGALWEVDLGGQSWERCSMTSIRRSSRALRVWMACRVSTTTSIRAFC